MKTLLAIAIPLICLVACDDDIEINCASEGAVAFPCPEVFERLSSYNLFEQPLSQLRPRAGVLPYDLNAALFSDYAQKQRFVYVPKGESISYDTTDALPFPVGTILVKNFFYMSSTGSRHLIETRLLLHQQWGWDAEVYEWNEDQTEAFRIVEGREKMIDFQQDGKLRTTRYQIPNKNQCKTCHAQGNNVVPIGPKVGNLNRSYTYDGVRENQLDRWVTAGILAVPPGNIPRWPNYSDVSESLTSRARAYLEVNCAHCHRAEGAASNTKLILQYYNYDSLSYGFRKRPVAPGAGSGGLTFNIVPGHAEQSILYYRMNSTDVRVRMPELGRNLIDEEGVALIKEWIDGMD